MYLKELFNISGKVVIVTGGNKGIGQAVALGLAKAGAEIVILSRTEADETNEMIANTGGSSYHIPTDIRDEDSVEAAMSEILKRSGTIDVLFNNSGIYIDKSTIETSVKEWEAIQGTNLTGAFIVARATGRIMIERGIHGSIINNASLSGCAVNIPQWQSAYNASKAGLIHFTRSLAVEWAEHKIRVNSISPGYIETPMSAERPQELLDTWIQLIPMHRMGKPEELTGAVIYLASDASTYTSGCNILVDGAYSCL
ncbi:SDR family oxidoreductase [Clostridium lacusfryxellense]|uniref:SDR family oxidoreductase n=1 Tax=Clostridium lacusfryxellense TaxID=205328 RepID=UPI001C0D8F46|nr:SDR family oxidoreductase [Clostridium lacusfryxellense]MBU3114426.1 SDR family oxidoreductase [Clostridium lacusfryxellense]